MGRITARKPVLTLRTDGTERRRPDTLAVEEPLEIRVGGRPLAVTMRTPGHDVELAVGFLVSEGVLSRGDQFAGAIHCGGPGTGGEGNTYNVLDLTLAAGVAPPAPEVARTFYTTSSCGVCGKASIEAVETVSAYDVSEDAMRIALEDLATLPDRLRAEQAVFDKTGGLHAAGLFDAATGEALVVREDVGRHNAVDKVVGWAAMAGIPMLAAVSAPSSLAVDLAAARGLTLVGFSRGASLNVYAGAERIDASAPAAAATEAAVPAAVR
jgi:FdhD protein